MKDRKTILGLKFHIHPAPGIGWALVQEQLNNIGYVYCEDNHILDVTDLQFPLFFDRSNIGSNTFTINRSYRGRLITR